MRRPTEPEWLLRSLRRCYEMRDAIEAIRSENTSPTLEDRIASSSIMQMVDGWIAYYNKELSLLARRGGRGLPLDVARGLASLVTERSGGAEGARARPHAQAHT